MDKGVWQATVHRAEELDTTEVTQHEHTHLMQPMMFKPLFQENHDFLTKQVWSLQYHTFENLSLSFTHSTKEQSDVQTALKRPQGETFNDIIHWFLQPKRVTQYLTSFTLFPCFLSIVFSYHLSLGLIVYSLILFNSQNTVKPFILPFSVKLGAISENNLPQLNDAVLKRNFKPFRFS